MAGGLYATLFKRLSSVSPKEPTVENHSVLNHAKIWKSPPLYSQGWSKGWRGVFILCLQTWQPNRCKPGGRGIGPAIKYITWRHLQLKHQHLLSEPTMAACLGWTHVSFHSPPPHDIFKWFLHFYLFDTSSLQSSILPHLPPTVVLLKDISQPCLSQCL